MTLRLSTDEAGEVAALVSQLELPAWQSVLLNRTRRGVLTLTVEGDAEPIPVMLHAARDSRVRERLARGPWDEGRYAIDEHGRLEVPLRKV